MKTAFRATLLVALAAIGGSGCATTRAETPRERPALDVPPPPPRVITPLPVFPEPPAPEPVSDLPGSSTQTPARPRPLRQAEAPKVEAKPEEAKPAETVPPTAPVPQLRMPETDPTQLTVQIRDIIDRTRKVLRGIDYGPLSNARKKAYDDANMFAKQAEDALKAEPPNLVFAKELADKAERLARELQGR
jgi:hypothetical protein